jgi:hypothetical protein
VCLWNVLEHVADTKGVLQEAARVLRPGWAVMILAPNYAAFRSEAHYHVPWPPLLPRPLALVYLRALGRDPQFYRDDVHPSTITGTARAMRAAGLVLRDRRLEKLVDPSGTSHPRARRIVRILRRRRLLWLARLILRVQLVNPIKPTILFEGVKPL